MIISKFLSTPPVRDWKFYLHLTSPAFHAPGQLVPRSYGKEFNKGKIVVFGLPKSGTTWLMNLLSDYFEISTAFLKSGGHNITKTHKPLSSIVYCKKIKKSVYILRDIRDSVVSYYHYSKTNPYKVGMDPSSHYNDIESFYYEYFLGKLIHRYNWIYHPDNYVTHGSPLIKYENLWDDPYKELHTLLSKWGFTPDRKQIEKSVENNQIQKLSQTGKKSGREHSSSHFRQGGHGGFKDELPEKILNDIDHRFSYYLTRWGYHDK